MHASAVYATTCGTMRAPNGQSDDTTIAAISTPIAATDSSMPGAMCGCPRRIVWLSPAARTRLISGPAKLTSASAKKAITSGCVSQFPVVAADRDEQVALDDAAEHEAEYQRWARPAEALHRPAERPERQQHVKIAPLARALKRADENNAEHEWQQRADAHAGNARELIAERQAQACAEHVRKRDAPDDRVRDVEVLGQQSRARHEPVDRECAEQDRH